MAAKTLGSAMALRSVGFIICGNPRGPIGKLPPALGGTDGKPMPPLYGGCGRLEAGGCPIGVALLEDGLKVGGTKGGGGNPLFIPARCRSRFLQRFIFLSLHWQTKVVSHGHEVL